MSTVQLLVTVMVFVFLSSCRASSTSADFFSHAAKYGLNESLNNSYQVERGILYADVMLSKDVPMRFVPTWPPSELTPNFKFTDTTQVGTVKAQCDSQKNQCVFQNARPIPVYLIDDDKLGDLENIFVPDGEACVFINVRSLRRLWDDFGMKAYEYPGGDLSRIHSISLAVMLLHEMGHLVYGDSGSYSAPAAFNADELSLGSQVIQNREIRADRFAAEQIIQGRTIDEKDSLAHDILGVGNDFVAGDMLRAVKAAVSSYEIDKDAWGIFDGRVKSVLISTSSYSHPNLFIRFQVIDYMLDPSAERYERLKSLGVAH